MSDRQADPGRRRRLRVIGIALAAGGLTATAFAVQQIQADEAAPAPQDRVAATETPRSSQAADPAPEEFRDEPAADDPIPSGAEAARIPDRPPWPFGQSARRAEAERIGPDAAPPIPPVIPEAPPEQGTTLGRIVIVNADVDWRVVEGVAPADLARGPGHMPGTAMPGQPGNAVISGHRTTYGAPFYHLDRLEPGDAIVVETQIGIHFYEVAEIHVVDPYAAWVIEQVDGAWLTLTTCHPRGRRTERLIVFARFVDGPNAAAIAALSRGDELPPRQSEPPLPEPVPARADLH